FTKPAVRNYSPAAFAWIAQEYAPDVMYVSHYRYANHSFWTNLFGCACLDCQHEAAELGYDSPRMKEALTRLPGRISRLGAGTFRRWLTIRPTMTDFFMMLGGDMSGMIEWFAFRAAVVSRSMKRLHDAVHPETNDHCAFVSDTHSATLAMLVGHNWEDFIDGANDAITPLSWLAIHYVATVASWAKQLCTLVDGLDETTSIRFVLRLFAWDDVGLPTGRIDDLRIAADGGSRPYMFGRPDTRRGWEVFYEMMNPVVTRKIMTHEYTRLAALSHRSIPAYPVVQGREWPRELCGELIGEIGTLGFPG
ncbi:MAG: hypothetical protein J7M24_06260, partial [Candidatus Latescibacteria bacterium]|nr:hypothetical protein [Candidatus Latescibacterota bacterium]